MIGPAHGLKKGDFQEVRMDVNNMVAAMAAKTVDAMVNVEPYNAIAESPKASAPHHGLLEVDKMPVFMAATPDFVDKNPDAVVAYLKAGSTWRSDFKDNPKKVADVIYSFFTSKGYKHVARHLRQGAGAASRSIRASPPISCRTCRSTPRCCCKEKKISAIPDWKKALRPDFMGQGQRVAAR